VQRVVGPLRPEQGSNPAIHPKLNPIRALDSNYEVNLLGSVIYAVAIDKAEQLEGFMALFNWATRLVRYAQSGEEDQG
jgi:hypothetical protein